ncbi:MAG: hypothetical protein JXD23_05310 [Spirochaetales bacterium]|nr:hypothetical protein [Spirochaetales bacterium]
MDSTNSVGDELNITSSLRRIINEDAEVSEIEGDLSVTAAGDSFRSSPQRVARIGRTLREREEAYRRRPTVWDLSRGRHIDIYA